jgi:radical SAM protein with 4Fe4S-binding SPASM domain
MPLDLFKKIVDDLAEFDRSIHVLRLYKDGEPFLNRNLAAMVAYAKTSERVPYVDTTTNASLLTPGTAGPVLEAGIDKINISIDGMSDEQYLSFTKYRIDFDSLVQNIRWVFENKGNTEIAIKIPRELISEAQVGVFYETFGNYCDRIFVENFAPCWPNFDVEERTGIPITAGIYQQPVGDTDTCPYIFYSMAVNADGLVSSCFLDWGRKLLIGDARLDSLKSIWNSEKMNSLRLLHLEGRRGEHPVCGDCGQLSHCLPDSIDSDRVELLERFREHLKLVEVR